MSLALLNKSRKPDSGGVSKSLSLSTSAPLHFPTSQARTIIPQPCRELRISS